MRISHLYLCAILSSSTVFSTLHDDNLVAGEPSGALKSFAKDRTWADVTGKHKIQGSLKFADEIEVQIAQTNGKIAKIKLSALSAADRKFVQTFLQQESETTQSDNPFLESDDSEETEMGNAGSVTKLDFNAASSEDEKSSDSARSTSDSLDPPRRKPILQNVKRFSGNFDKPFWSVKPIKGFPDISLDEFGIETSLTQPTFASSEMISGGTFGVSVLGIHREKRFDDPAFSRFITVFGKDGTVSEVSELNSPWRLKAMSPDGTKVAMVRVEGFGKGNDVGIFKVTRNGLVPEFQFLAGGGSFDEIHFVGFGTGNRLVTISQKNNVGVWDLANEKGPKALYVGNSGGALHAEMSPARELMALPAGNGVAIIDLGAAKLSGLIQRSNKPSQLSFSPNGKMLAVFEPFSVSIYNMENGELIRDVPVSESNGEALLKWLGSYLMVGDVVYDVQRVIPIWTYDSGQAVKSAVGSYLYTAFPSDKGTTVSLSKLPHESAIAAAASVDPKNIYAIRPGDEVSVEYNLRTTPSDKQAEIKKNVEEKIRKLGWKLVPTSTLRVVVEMEESKPQTAEFYTVERRGGGPMFPPAFFGQQPSGPKETVNYVTWTHKLTIYSGDKKDFEVTHVQGVPSSLSTNEGESTQAAVSRVCQPQPSYFQYMAIAPNLLKLEYQGGLGKSTITPDGLR